MPSRRPFRLCALLLAALLLLAQHSAWVHELGHMAAAHEPQDGDVPHAPVELCRLCLVFVSIDTAAAPPSTAMQLPAALPYHPTVLVSHGTARIAAPAQRSRSPPVPG